MDLGRMATLKTPISLSCKKTRSSSNWPTLALPNSSSKNKERNQIFRKYTCSVELHRTVSVLFSFQIHVFIITVQTLTEVSSRRSRIPRSKRPSRLSSHRHLVSGLHILPRCHMGRVRSLGHHLLSKAARAGLSQTPTNAAERSNSPGAGAAATAAKHWNH